MKKQHAKAPTGAPCTSTISGGVMKCMLVGDHGGVHSSSTAGKRASQYAIWQLAEDGRMHVTTYNLKKKMAEWFEDAPEAPKSNLCGARWERGADGTRIPKDKQIECGRDPGHDGPHRGFAVGGHHVSTWTGNGSSGGMHTPQITVADERSAPAGELTIVYDDHETTIAIKEGESGDSIATRAAAAINADRTMIGDHPIHPAAALFPMIDAAEYPAFAADIGKNGQRKKIVRIKVGSSWQILDGRNRLRACLQLGIEPKFREFGDEYGDGDDPIEFVVSENIHRRHLNETQRSFVGAELVPMYQAQARERQRAAGGDHSKPLPPNSAEAGEAVEMAARAVNVGKTSIKAAMTVKQDAAPEVLAAAKDRGHLKVSAAAELSRLPKAKQKEIVEKVGKGEIRSGKVRALVKQEEKRETVRSINEQKVAPMPLGQFGVIYGDYPWAYDNSDQHEGSRGHLGYPAMTMQQILDHARETSTRAAKDCVIALWVTNLYIPQIGRVIEAYGAEWRTMVTWPKQRAGVGTWPRGQTEHLVIASIGAPVHTLNEITTLLEPYASREHSRKPDEVADLLRKHCSGPFLELFAREAREGWVTWGAERDKFTEAA